MNKKEIESVFERGTKNTYIFQGNEEPESHGRAGVR